MMKKIKEGNGDFELTTVEGGQALGKAAWWQAPHVERRKRGDSIGYDQKCVPVEWRNSRAW